MSYDKLRFMAVRENGPTVTVEIDGQSNLSDAIDAVETFLVAAGYHHQNVAQALGMDGFPECAPTAGGES